MKVVDDPSVSGRNEEMNSLLAALSGLLKGDASVRLPLHWSGVSGKVADAFNAVVQQRIHFLVAATDAGIVDDFHSRLLVRFDATKKGRAGPQDYGQPIRGDEPRRS